MVWVNVRHYKDKEYWLRDTGLGAHKAGKTLNLLHGNRIQANKIFCKVP
jgi:hypothetical protein